MKETDKSVVSIPERLFRLSQLQQLDIVVLRIVGIIGTTIWQLMFTDRSQLAGP
jgi:hypothetical protein